ncbi:MAG: type II toxin-antitoxin system RelE/ParE family toxin [Pseudomonadota bacterium]|nr:type II toxin-antitoxin system RelE/ParE family toxin [Pseudomonadota bacterium]
MGDADEGTRRHRPGGLCGPQGQQLTVLHVFTKKTQKTPRRALETARARLRRLSYD